MKQCKRAISMLLILCMVVAMLPITAVASEVGTNYSDYWDGTSIAVIEEIDGVFRVSTAAELAWIAKEVNQGNTFNGKTILLCSNINLNSKSWTPIGSSKYPFQGDFDGNGYSIGNLSSTGGLFGCLSGNIKIFDLKIINASVHSSASTGILAGNVNLTAGNNVTIENCYIAGTVSVYGDLCSAGGVIGKVDVTESASLILNHLKYEGTVSSGAGLGCTVYEGGLIGRIEDTNRVGSIQIFECVVDSTVSGDADPGYTESNAGGLIGEFSGDKLNIQQCVVLGSVSSRAYGPHCGGFLGNIDYNSLNITDSMVSASIIAQCTNGQAVAGGFIGKHTCASSPLLSCIENCFVTGSMTATIKSGFISWNDSKTQSVSIKHSYFNADLMGITDITHKVCQCSFMTVNWITNSLNSTSQGLSDNDMKNQSSYLGWDFENIWECDNSGYPSLKILSGDFGSSKDEKTNVGTVQFLCRWDEETHNISFNSDQVSPNFVAESMDTSGISDLVGKYVLATTNPDSPLEVTSIQPVESKIGTCSAVNGQTMTVDGVSYPVPDSWIGVDMYAGKDVLYHVSEGKIVGADILVEKSGILEDWDSVTGRATIGGTVYPTNYLSDLSFSNSIDEYLQKGINFVTVDSSKYHPLLKVTGSYYPGGKSEDFNKDIYHATWLSRGGNDADILKNQTPSEILINQIDESNGDLAMDLWRSFEVVFETLDDVTTLYDFVVEPKDVYSALILNALEDSVSYDVIASELKDGVKLSKALISDLSTMLKADFGIDINNDDELQEFVSQLDGSAEKNIKDFTDDWFKINYPELKFYKEYFKWISSGIKAVGTAEDLADYCSSCYALMQISDSMKAVLEHGYQKSIDTYGSLSNITRAFKECLDMITRSSDEMFDQVEKRAVFVVGEQGAKYIIGDLLWSKFTDYIKTACPELAILQLGYKVGKTVSNWLCNTDDAIEQYLKMSYITDIEFLIDLVHHDMELEFDKNPTAEHALAYLSAVELSFLLRDVDCETASKYVDVLIDAFINKVDIFNGALVNSDSLLNGALLNNIGQAFGKKDYSELKKIIDSIRSNYAAAYVGAGTNWINYLEEDYPGAGLEQQYEHLFDDIRNIILKKEFKAACPVDVYVYDKTNNVVAFIANGKVSCSVNDVVVALIGDTKIIRFYNDADYRIEYVGNDIGDMDITITEYNSDEEAVRTVNYYDVPLTTDKTYSLDTGNEILRPYELEDKADNSIVNFDYDSMVTSTLHTVKVLSGTLLQNGEIYVETTAKKGETLQLDAYVPDGYEFICWESSSEAAKISDSSSRNTAVIMPDEDTIITAVMREPQSKPTTYTVSFASNGGTVDVATMTTGTNGKLSSLPTPTRNGYTFDGWFTSTDGGDKITTDTIFSTDSTVYAHWTYNNSELPTQPKFTITFDPTGGTVSPVSDDTNETGKLSVFPTPIRSGYTFDGWFASADGGSKITTDTAFNANTTVYAHWTYIGGGSSGGNGSSSSSGGGGGGSSSSANSISVPNTSGGKVSVSPSNASAGTKVTITVTPDPNYELDQIAVTDSKGTEMKLTNAGDDKYTFIMPNGKVSITAAFRSGDTIWDNPYTDAADGVWYYDAVRFVSENGLMSGYGGGKFAPDSNLTRAMLVQILYSKAGCPDVVSNETFTDVPTAMWYTNAVTWAQANGIVSGYGNGRFGPNDNITREQLSLILWRYVGNPAATSKELDFADADDISGYAAEALKWAVENKIISGYGNGILAPRGYATRAQTAQMLKNFFEK